MPIYEYQCQSCSGAFEILQAMGAAPPDGCPRCGGRVERIPSSPSTNFNRFTGPSAERYAKLTVEQQARSEADRLIKHSKNTGIPLKDLFEDHDHH